MDETLGYAGTGPQSPTISSPLTRSNPHSLPSTPQSPSATDDGGGKYQMSALPPHVFGRNRSVSRQASQSQALSTTSLAQHNSMDSLTGVPRHSSIEDLRKGSVFSLYHHMQRNSSVASIVGPHPPNTSYPCYSRSCKCDLQPADSAPKPWSRAVRCYSPTCQQRYRSSWWKHPKIRKLMTRASIFAGLRSKGKLPPLASFVPRLLHEYLFQLADSSHDEIAFGAVKLGAVLFADASGFTALTERLAKNKANGAEMLCKILNNFFTILVRIVHDFGGDIVKFAGDALSIVWVIDEDAAEEGDRIDEAMAQVTLWAAQCACQIHKELHNFQATEGPDPVLLSMHMGIGCGLFTCIHVGGLCNRWEYVVAGPPMAQIAVAEPLARSGETVVSPVAWELIKDKATGTPLGELVHICNKPAKSCPIHRPKNPTKDEYDYVRLDTLRDGLPMPPPIAPLTLTEKHMNFLRLYIPAAILPRLKSGQDGYLAELRDVSVVFVKCTGLSISADEDGNCAEAIDSGFKLMLAVQQAVYRWEGSVNKFLVDDKGLLMLCVFGLPPMSHADDTYRAVGAAQAIIESVSRVRSDNSVGCSVGIATGQAFCGVVGSLERREYTVMGDVVNLSARLMGEAGTNEVLVDVTTKLQSDAYVEYEERAPLELKGKEGLVSNFRPLRAVNKKTDINKSKLALAARWKEHQVLHSMVTKSEYPGVTIVLTGERGSGKSSLAAAIYDIGTSNGFKVLKGDNKSSSESRKANGAAAVAAGAWKRSIAKLEGPTFTAWQSVLEQLVAESAKKKAITPREWVISVLPDCDKPHAALLNLIMPSLDLELPPQDLDSDTKGHRRKHRRSIRTTKIDKKPFWMLNTSEKVTRMRQMMLVLLEKYARDEKTMIVLHLQTGTAAKANVDPESWVLAYHVNLLCVDRSEFMPKLVMCLITRPLINFVPSEFTEIVSTARGRGTLLQLKPLSKEQRYTYLVQVLGAADIHELPQELVSYVSDFAAGNPKHIEELCVQLKKEKAISVDDGRVTLHNSNLETTHMPDKMSGHASQLIDRMQPRPLLVVKVASTFSQFTIQTLQEIFPMESEVMELPSVVEDLVESGILQKEMAPASVKAVEPEAEFVYSFHSKLVQQQANKLLLHRYRRELEHSKAKLATLTKIRQKIVIQTKTSRWLSSIESINTKSDHNASSMGYRYHRDGKGNIRLDIPTNEEAPAAAIAMGQSSEGGGAGGSMRQGANKTNNNHEMNQTDRYLAEQTRERLRAELEAEDLASTPNVESGDDGGISKLSEQVLQNMSVRLVRNRVVIRSRPRGNSQSTPTTRQSSGLTPEALELAFQPSWGAIHGNSNSCSSSGSGSGSGSRRQRHSDVFRRIASEPPLRSSSLQSGITLESNPDATTTNL